MDNKFSKDELLASIGEVEDPQVREVLQALWLFETGEPAPTYKDFYRTQLESGANADHSINGNHS